MRDAGSQTEVGQRTRRKITRRLMPFLFLLYLVAYLDRVNVSFAALDMTKELGMTHAQFGFGAGVFFIGYFLLEIPGAVLVEAWSARKWIARIMVTWGFIAAGTGLVNSVTQFYWLRFALGLAEAGFFPGMIVYLSHWYRARDRAKAVAMFMIAIPMSEILGAPISAALMRIDWLGWPGWRWLLILEGLPAVVLGVVTLLYLTDRPRDAKWLAPDERDWIEGELAREQGERHGHRVLDALKNRRVYLLMAAYFTLMNLGYGILMWLPKILQSVSGAGTSKSTLLTALPYALATPVVLWLGWRSDRRGERRWHAAVPLFIGAAALALFPLAASHIWFAVALFAVALIGQQGCKGPFWAIATTLLAGRAGAAGVGLINSFGNLGGFVGPYTVGWLATQTQGFHAGVLYLVCCSAAAAVFVLLAGARQTAAKATAAFNPEPASSHRAR